MALESMAALGLASNIIQFVDFGCRLFSKSRELYQSTEDSVAEHIELDNIASFLSRISQTLTVSNPSPGHAPREESQVESLASTCKKIADELSHALDQLKAKGPKRKKWQCFRITLKRIWKSEQIDAMARRLDSCSSALTLSLVQILR